MKSKRLSFEEFYSSFFQEIIKRNIKYSVIRNYELLPYDKPGNDVDILINEENKEEIIDLISEIIKPYNGKVIITYENLYVIKLQITNIEEKLKSNKNHTELDLLKSLKWKGIEWLDHTSVINRSSLNKEKIFIPSKEDEFLMSLFHSLLYGGFVKKRYTQTLKHLYSQSNKKYIFNIITHYFNNETYEIIEKYADNNPILIQNHVFIIRKALIQASIKKNKLITIKNVIQHYSIEFNHKILKK